MQTLLYFSQENFQSLYKQALDSLAKGKSPEAQKELETLHTEKAKDKLEKERLEKEKAEKDKAEKVVTDNAAATNASGEPRVELMRLYVKDLSLQIPEGSRAFQLEWKPELNFEINTQAKGLNENNFEVSIRLKCTNTCSGKAVLSAIITF